MQLKKECGSPHKELCSIIILFVKIMKQSTILTLMFCGFLGLASLVLFLLFSDFDRCSDIEHLNPSKKFMMGKSYFLVVLILSSLKNVENRMVLRNTWLQFCNDDIKCYFVVGTKSLSEHDARKIEDEESKYKDLLKIPNVQDSYDNLTLKVLESFVWLNDNTQFKFVLKCDDDTFVNIPELTKTLSNFEKDGKNLYMGFFNGHATVQKNGKWKEDKWVLCDYYLPYALGGGYVLSYQLIHFIARNANDLVLYNSEDASVGVWLASKSEISRVHDTRFDTEFISRGCSNTYIVTHKRDKYDQEKLYNNLLATGKLCEKEHQTRLSYVYNWNVPPSQCCKRTSSVP